MEYDSAVVLIFSIDSSKLKTPIKPWVYCAPYNIRSIPDTNQVSACTPQYEGREVFLLRKANQRSN